MSGHDPTLAGVQARLAAGATPADEIRVACARLAAYRDPALLLHAGAGDTMAALAGSGPLAGVALVVKDNIDVAGMPTTAGCPSFAYMPGADAAVVARLRAAGAVPVAKANLDQFATGLVGTRSPHGTPRNPIDATRIPGGSSSGSAMAVAAGLVSAALGTDTAGSGRVPAAFANIVGFKPTRGLLSTRGVVPAVRSLDCVSVFAHTVADAWTVLAIAAGFDGDDPYSRRAEEVDLPDGPLRIGVPPLAALEADLAPHLLAGWRAAASALEALGHALVAIDLDPFLAAAGLLYQGPWVAERTAAVGDHLATAIDGDPTVAAIVRGGRAHDAVAAYRGAYELARLRRLAEAQWQRMDVLLLPTVREHPTLAEVAAEPFTVNARLGRYTNFANLLDTCAVALPAALAGLPAGVTLFAPASHDAALHRLGVRLQEHLALPLGATGWPSPAAPPLPPSSLVTVAVFGAHLRDQPLNPRLVALGGRFLGDCRTAPRYRCHLIPGRIDRPGLVATEVGGAAIAGELWALPPAGFGRLVAEVTAPLAIGPLHLDDGRMVPGYLCAGVLPAAARDISAHGGWRAFLAAR